MSAPQSTDYRVRVRRVAAGEWRAVLVDTTAGPSDASGDIIVGAFGTHPEAVRTGISALRFVSAGIPWRAS